MGIFTKATRRKSKARIALDGPSGSGKTWTSLSIAQGLGERICVIDTEHGSASLYADDFDFDVKELSDFSPEKLTKLLHEAAKESYEVVVIDSFSLFWSGTNGMLEQADMGAVGGNTFVGWKKARPMERKMIDAILSFPGHVIATMRSKTEYVISENERGKKVPQKVGLKPEQREGIEYEFTIVGNLDHDHTMVVSKSRCSALAGAVIELPDSAVGQTIREWIEKGEAKPKDELDSIIAKALDPETTLKQFKDIYLQAELGGFLDEWYKPENDEPHTVMELIKEKGALARARESAAQVSV